ncbi:MAG: DUF3164 family protein [Campylobacter sp.]|nr:DUF3164 family protein [Campylobacter sp.]
MAKLDEKGFWQNKEGNFIHKDMISIDKQLEDEVVEKLLEKAKELQKVMREFKEMAYKECYDFIDLLRQNYNMDKLENSKTGSVTLKSFNGSKEVQIQIAKQISFDQKLALAKEKIDEYLDEKTENADAEIRTLITRAFDVKNGKVDAKMVLSLKQYPITNPKWTEAMKMIDEAVEIVGTKSYIRFKERDGGKVDGAIKSLVLDIAGL